MRISLKYRIALIIFALEALMMTAVLWATLDHLEDAIGKQFASSERTILNIMSGISHIALLTGEYSELQPYLENLLEDTRIEQVLLVDARGIVVAGTRPESIGKFPTAFSRSDRNNTAIQPRRFWRTADVRSEDHWLGVLAIEISDAALQDKSVEARNLGIGIAVLGMLLIAVVGLTAGFLLTRRLGRVTHAAHRFAQGETTARADIRGRDEIGDLGRTFDQMADSLESSSTESQRLIEQLSDKNAELERFAYTVSHDLKSPLITIRGFVGLLVSDLQADDRDRVEKDLQQIASAADTMQTLLDDLLELSRIGRITNPPVRVKLGELVDEALIMATGRIDEHGVRVSVAPNSPKVFGDRKRLLEVVLNLIDNAGKFVSTTQRPRIEITYEDHLREVICHIADNGPGIESRYHDKVFGLFERLDPTIEGTGIGLALAKRIIEVHGGRIWIVSEGNNNGCRVSFSLPKPDEVLT